MEWPKATRYRGVGRGFSLSTGEGSEKRAALLNCFKFICGVDDRDGE